MRTMLLLAIVGLCGCATILSKNSEVVHFTSDPVGQEIMVDGTAHTTPAAVPLSTEMKHLVRFPDGSTTEIHRGLNGWFLLNVFFLPGFVVDLVSGDVNNSLYPRHIEYRDGKIYDRNGKEIGPKKKELEARTP